MRPNLPKVPLHEIYVRSGLKSLSERVLAGPVRGAVDDVKSKVQTLAKERLPAAAASAEHLVRRFLVGEEATLASVVNATGILAPKGYALPLADVAVTAVAEVSAGYSTSATAVEELLIRLSGAEAACVVHSPAIAAIATLSVLGGTVIVARDQVVPVDGVSLVDVVALSKTALCELGTLGRTTLADYRKALKATAPNGVWLSRATSVRVIGDTQFPATEEVIAIARDQQVPTVEYLESAAFFEIEGSAAAQSLPQVKDSLARGADLVILPGDAFLGGPRCGIILGREKYVSRIAEHALTRASDFDAPRRAALLATLQCALSFECRGSIPIVQLLLASAENLQQRAERLAVQLRECPAVLAAEVMPNTVGYLNDARLPDQQILGSSVRVTPKAGTAEQLAVALGEQRPGIAAKLMDNCLELALQSVLPRQDEQIVAAFQALH